MANGDLVTTLLTGDLVSYPTNQIWGIYLGGANVVTADTVSAFEYKQNWALSDYPVEEGGFETYDKVSTPFDVRIRFAAGGSESNRAAMLASIAAIAGDLNLYDVVTPEVVYQSVNISHYDYRRTAVNGVGLIVVEVWCLEVRVLGESSGGSGGVFSTGTTPVSTTSGGEAIVGGADPFNGGSVQATPYANYYPGVTQPDASNFNMTY